MTEITSCLWFNDNGEDAAKFYTSLFNDSKITAKAVYGKSSAAATGRPEGSVLTVTFELDGAKFMALNGGPNFSFSPATSFFIACETEEEVDNLFNKLSDGGSILMPLDKYPFSPKFAWINDKFGLSWQINLEKRAQKITPFLMFVNENHGKAKEAIEYYVSQFEDSAIKNIWLFEAGEHEPEGSVKRAVFSLAGREFMVLESKMDHQFNFTPAVSFVANCETQAEIDRLWEGLSAGGNKSHCGWLDDKYGVSWQVIPTVMSELMKKGDVEKGEQMMAAMMQMTKLDADALQMAYTK